MPLVSVVISTYNRAHYLKRAVVSVLGQTFQDFELIIVDNASEDTTQELIASFKDPRIRSVRHETNRGGPAARNTGITVSQGKYIALLDDDDQWMPDKLVKQVRRMNDTQDRYGLVYVGSEIFDELNQRVETVNVPQWRGNIYQRLLLSTVIGSVSSVLVRKDCFMTAGLFDETLSSCQDWDMWLRIAKSFEFDFVPEILARINVHGRQISSDYQALIPGRTRMVEKHRAEFEQVPKVYVVHLKRLGKLHFINGTWSEGIRWFKEALKVDRKEIFKIIGWCLFELPAVKWFSKAKDFKRYSA